jgi:hypothetical protein
MPIVDTPNVRAASYRERPPAIPDLHAAGRLRRAPAWTKAAIAIAAMIGIATPIGAAAAPIVAAPGEATIRRLAALDCSRVDVAAVHDVLAHVPAPRIVLLEGSVAIVSMEPFARFLVRMGYPEARLRNPRDGSHSYGSFADSALIAGALAFDYEQTGVEPMLIGHSQGGMLAIRVLYEFSGEFHESLPVVDPLSGRPLERTTIVDPVTHRTRPVVGLHVAYAAALATGWLPRVLLGQWTMLQRLRRIPDSVTEFTGFDIPNDVIAGNLLGITPYAAVGSALVRNVVLPSGYRHIELPDVEALADDDASRAWIDQWAPDVATPAPADARNIIHAADVWYSVKRHWCRQAQRLLTGSSS